MTISEANSSESDATRAIRHTNKQTGALDKPLSRHFDRSPVECARRRARKPLERKKKKKKRGETIKVENRDRAHKWKWSQFVNEP